MTFGNLRSGARALMAGAMMGVLLAGAAFAQDAGPVPPASTPAVTDAGPLPDAKPAQETQSAPDTPPPSTQGPATPAPDTPSTAAPAPGATPAPAPATAAPASPAPGAAPPTAPAPGPAGPAHTDTVMGGTTVLNPVPVLIKSASSSWDEGFDTIVATVDTITAEMNRLGLRRAGEVMISYTSSDEAGFEFEAQVPFAGDSAEKPGDGVKIGASYSGRAMKFHHSGSFADMDATYEGIANYLDSRNIEGQDFYIERYLTDPAAASPEALEVDIFVPLR